MVAGITDPQLTQLISPIIFDLCIILSDLRLKIHARSEQKSQQLSSSHSQIDIMVMSNEVVKNINTNKSEGIL